MKEHPILFGGPMVRAILAGQKTQTRRASERWANAFPGDVLRVRETMRVVALPSALPPRVVRVRYEADGKESGWLPYPARLAAPVIGRCIAYGGHREGSRLFLALSAVHRERLHAITTADIKAEGMTVAAAMALLGHSRQKGIAYPSEPWTLRDAWRIGWSAINGVESWESNPWVWALSFTRIGGPS